MIQNNRMWPAPPKLLTSAIIVLGHVIALSVIFGQTSSGQSTRQSAYLSAVMVEIANQDTTSDTVPLPDIKLITPSINTDALKSVRFEDLEDNMGVMGSASSPRLSRLQVASPEFFAGKAGIQLHEPTTVVLAILVLQDGRVGDVQVTRSSGSAKIDAVAIEYAQTLRWIPGTRDHQPQAMRISFPVILSPNA
jgi:TonB family protein